MGKLKAIDKPIDLKKFMGSWYVNAVNPTPFEKNAFNPVETYSWKDRKRMLVDVDFKFNKKALDGKVKKLPQTLKVNMKNGKWKVYPSSWLPIGLTYNILAIENKEIKSTPEEHKDNYDFVVVGNSGYFWIMTRSPNIPDEVLEEGKAILVKNGLKPEKAVYPKHNGMTSKEEGDKEEASEDKKEEDADKEEVATEKEV